MIQVHQQNIRDTCFRQIFKSHLNSQDNQSGCRQRTGNVETNPLRLHVYTVCNILGVAVLCNEFIVWGNRSQITGGYSVRLSFLDHESLCWNGYIWNHKLLFYCFSYVLNQSMFIAYFFGSCRLSWSIKGSFRSFVV